MDIQTGFFYLFAAVLLFSAFRVVTARNPVHAVLYLMLTFSQASGLWFLLNAEFLAITLVLVYLGAVMVLFLFVVMMLDINMDTLRAGFWKHFPLAATLGAVVAFEMGAVLMSGFRLAAPAAVDAAAQANNAKALGVLLYTDYLMPIQIAAATAAGVARRKPLISTAAISKATTAPSVAASGKFFQKPARSVSMLMSSIITTNRNSTMTAPRYTSTRVMARNSALSRNHRPLACENVSMR